MRVSPSAAESTEMAGVMTPSPQSMLAPNKIRRVPAPMARFLPAPESSRALAKRAKMPPSPRLSARVTKVRYFQLTTIISDQKMSERMPSTPVVRSASGR